jgi:hypothetical protein
MAITQYLKPTSRFSIFFYLLLRGLQLLSLAISAFTFCYIVWQHNHHYCANSAGSSSCDYYQRAEAKVPVVYVALITAASSFSPFPQPETNRYQIIASGVAAFYLIYKHLTAVLDTLSGNDPFPRHPIILETPVVADGKETTAAFRLIIKPISRAIRSSTHTAVLIDVFLLMIFVVSFNEYTWHVVWGKVVPYANFWPTPWKQVGQLHYYYKDLKVIYKEAIISQCAWTASLFAM